MKTISVNKKEYPIKFTLSVVKRFAQSMGMKTMDEFTEWISSIDPNNFDALDKMCGLFLAAFKKGCKLDNIECTLEQDDVFDLLSDNPKAFEDLMKEFTQSQESEPTELETNSGKETEEKKSQ